MFLPGSLEHRHLTTQGWGRSPFWKVEAQLQTSKSTKWMVVPNYQVDGCTLVLSGCLYPSTKQMLVPQYQMEGCTKVPSTKYQMYGCTEVPVEGSHERFADVTVTKTERVADLVGCRH